MPSATLDVSRLAGNAARFEQELEFAGEPSGKERSNVVIWDTEYHPPSEAVGIFRDGVRKAFMPWTPDLTSTQEFSARIESSALEAGQINRIRVTPHKTERTPADVMNSVAECVYMGFMLGGSIHVEQGGHSTTVRPGDMLITRSDIPKAMAQEPGVLHQALVLVIPLTAFSETIKNEALYTNFVVPQEKLIRPLSTCVTFLSEHLLSASPQEMSALLDTFIALLPLATGFAPAKSTLANSHNEQMFGALLEFVNKSISNSDLSPQMAADYLGISSRYVHKLFAGCGVTFSTYVMAKRLDHIRQELSSQSCCKQSIAALAYRWGFEDLSTFNRAFKTRFGCTPSQSRYRGRF